MEETRVCTFELKPEGYVLATMKDGASFELADAEEAVAVTRRVAGKRCAVLVDMRRIKSQSKEARAYFSDMKIADYMTAVALLVASPLSRLIANFFLRFGSQPVPTRLFDREDEARAWLLEHVTT